MTENTTTPAPGQPRPLRVIAAEIENDWGSKVNYAARPYLDALRELDTVQDDFGVETGRAMVLYFLSNAGAWRGETARRVKKELKGMVGSK